MGRIAACALLGFLVGAATLAGGEEDWELEEKLLELQQAVDRALHRVESDRGLPVVTESGFELGLVGVSDLVRGVRDHYLPSYGIGSGREDSEIPLFGGVSEEAVQPFGSIEELAELIRASVWPETWDEGAVLGAARDHLFVLNRPPVVREVRRYLDQTLRSLALRCVRVEAEIADVAAADYVALSAGEAGYETVRERATPIFACQATGMPGQRFLIWHGRQVAAYFDADVEVAESAQTSDPVVEVVQVGGSLCVRPQLTNDSARVFLDVDLRRDELDGAMEQAETEACRVLEMPRVAQTRARASQLVEAGRWILVGAAAREGGAVRVLLVRAHVRAWPGGVR